MSLSVLLKPSHWSKKFYFVVALILLAVNLFGPSGLLRWVIMEQSKGRLLAEEKNLQSELVMLQKEIDQFENSNIAKERAIKDVLGYLREDEGSVELLVEDKSTWASKISAKKSSGPKDKTQLR